MKGGNPSLGTKGCDQGLVSLIHDQLVLDGAKGYRRPVTSIAGAKLTSTMVKMCVDRGSLICDAIISQHRILHDLRGYGTQKLFGGLILLFLSPLFDTSTLALSQS